MKKFLVIFISFILIFNFITPSYASVFGELGTIKPTDTLKPETIDPKGDEYTNKTNGNSEKLSGAAQTALDIINGLSNLILKPLKALVRALPTIEGSIWAKQDTFQLSFFSASTKGFAGTLQGIIGGLYNTLRYMVAAIYVVILVYLGLRMLLSSIGRQKAHYKDLLQYWLTGLLLLFAFHWVMSFIIWGSDTITKMLADIGDAQIVKVYNQTAQNTTEKVNLTNHVINLIDKTEDNDMWKLVSIPVNIILLFALIIYALFIVITYVKRFFTVALLIVLFPLVALSYVFDKIGDRRSQTFSTWFKEFTVNVFVQPIHALLLLLVVFLFDLEFIKNTPIVGPILVIILFALIPIGEKQIKTLFQINSSMGPGSNGLGGALGTLAHAGIAAKTLGGYAKSAGETLKQAKGHITAAHLTNKSLRASARKAIDQNNIERQKTGKALLTRKKQREVSKTAKREKWNKLKNNKNYQDTMKQLKGQKEFKASRFRNLKHNGKFSSGSSKKGNKALCFLKGSGKVIKGAAKASTVLAGAGIGLGKALATTSDMGALLPNMTKSTLAGAAGGLLVANIPGKIGKFISPDTPEELKEAKILANSNLNRLSKDQKKKLAATADIDVELINNDNKGYIQSRLDAKLKSAKYGVKFTDFSTSAFAKDNVGINRILSGKDAVTGEKFSDNRELLQNYDTLQTKNNFYFKHKETGEIFKINGYGSSAASDNPTWKDGAKANETYINDLKTNATTLVDAMNKNGAFGGDTKRYTEYMTKEVSSATREATSHISTLSNITNTTFSAPEVRTFTQSVIPEPITNMAKAKEVLSQEAFQTVSKMEFASESSRMERINTIYATESCQKAIDNSGFTPEQVSKAASVILGTPQTNFTSTKMAEIMMSPSTPQETKQALLDVMDAGQAETISAEYEQIVASYPPVDDMSNKQSNEEPVYDFELSEITSTGDDSFIFIRYGNVCAVFDSHPTLVAIKQVDTYENELRTYNAFVKNDQIVKCNNVAEGWDSGLKSKIIGKIFDASRKNFSDKADLITDLKAGF